MKNFTQKLWAFLMLMIVSLQAMATDTFTANRTDFRDESIYFMITTRFYDGDPGNNVLCWDNQEAQESTKDPCWRGDFQGVIDKLDYIKALGFTAIWITPIVQNASGYDYHGYHAMDFSKIDCRYQGSDGTKPDVLFQELIDKAHAKGIKIILDIVLNHTSNFGEEKLCKLFNRDEDLHNQASINACMIPDATKLGNDYLDNVNLQYSRRLAWLKNTDGQNRDSHNYWHHTANNWNWDFPSRWMGQIAGDCVDLNTENDEVAKYLVDCYGQFIKMGVDGFRIDTSGHISRLTFNKEFIPQFAALGKQYASKRLGSAPFFMYGEVCTRMNNVTYRDQPNLSCYFYTWQSDQSLLNQWNGSQSYWDTQVLPEGAEPVGPQQLALQETTSPKSNNAKMLNGAWHEPDYSQSSGYNVIDFPMHYSYNTASQAFSMASGDECYNDATYNVVYVDSHDYSPGPNDTNRFPGTDSQWAENLSLLFTFRGIPCIYYGSEIAFRRGVRIDPGPNGPLSNTGRAYFGGYITGDVTATDFGEYTASGNVAATLNHDIAQHLIRLNKIRQAVPALRKGQWTTDGCSANGGIAFKRAYKDSYALVALNGGATFTGCPAGTYTDVVTGQKYSGGTITVDAPHTQGQVRVLVKDWNGGKIGEDGPFIYASSAQHKGNQSYDGHEEDGTTYLDPDDVRQNSVVLSPNGGTFKTETLDVKIKLSDASESGWYELDGNKVNLTKGEVKTVTIGKGMNFKDTKTITWSATNAQGSVNTGSATYKKVEPNATISIYVATPSGNSPTVYAWHTDTGSNVELNGSWPGKSLSQSIQANGKTYYMLDCADAESVNVIFSNDGSNKTADIKGITEDAYFTYDGNGGYTKDDVDNDTPQLTLNPNGGTFKTETIEVTAKMNDKAVSGWYQIGNGAKVTLTKGESKTFTIGSDMKGGDTKTVTWSATNAKGETKTGTATYTKVDATAGITIYVKASTAPYLYIWDDNQKKLNGDWPGNKMSETTTVDGVKYWTFTVTDAPSFNVIFNNNNGGQTADITNVTSDTYFTYDGGSGYTKVDNGSNPTPNPTPGGGFYAYFLAPADWSIVKAWVWSDAANYTGGAWPGQECTKTGEKKDGLDVWKWTYSGSLTDAPTKIIFNNGNNGAGQTGNFDFVNGAVYNYSGKTNYVVTAIDGMTFSAKARKSAVYTLNGVKVAEVGSISDAEYVLAPGIYIWNGKKFVIK